MSGECVAVNRAIRGMRALNILVIPTAETAV